MAVRPLRRKLSAAAVKTLAVVQSTNNSCYDKGSAFGLKWSPNDGDSIITQKSSKIGQIFGMILVAHLGCEMSHPVSSSSFVLLQISSWGRL